MLGGHSGREEGCARKVVLGGGAAGGGMVLISLSNPLFQCGEAMSNHLYHNNAPACSKRLFFIHSTDHFCE